MRRPAHGGTTHPVLNRPGNGFGRPAMRRPGPLYAVERAPDFEPTWLLEPDRAPAELRVGPEARPEVIGLTDDRP